MTSPSRRAKFEAVIFGLLACNTIYYIVAGRFSEALESVAWYALLILFLLETTRGRYPFSTRVLTLIHRLRLMATLAILASAVFYVREQEWLDAINLFLWIAVVVMLEIKIRQPAAVAAHRRTYAITATLLYAALGVLVVIWLTRREWMDAWDAALWLAAFGVLEMNLLNSHNI